MTPDLLRQAGEALFGPHWQSALGRELGVADRTVRRWVAGDAAMPAGVRDDLIRLLQARGAELVDVTNRLSKTRSNSVTRDGT